MRRRRWFAFKDSYDYLVMVRATSQERAWSRLYAYLRRSHHKLRTPAQVTNAGWHESDEGAEVLS